MMFNLLRAYLSAEKASLRRVLSGLAMIVMSGGVLLLAIGFAFLAAFWGLAEVMPPWLAALTLTATGLVVALILRLAGQSLIRSRRSRDAVSPQDLANLLAREIGLAKPDLKTADATGFVVLAAIAGIIIGRRLSK
ncbi:MAG: phage holin family protein [Alphaproteobacteria bacterium]|nr:phage holin family protein [Alphaproteobacteria bacterium]